MSMYRLLSGAILTSLAMAVTACKPVLSNAAADEATHNLAPPTIILPDTSGVKAPEVVDHGQLAHETLELFYELLATRQVREARTLVLDASEPRRLESLASNLGYTAELMSAGRLEIEVLNARAQGRWAVAATRVKTKAEVRDRDEFLYRRDGKWLIAPEAVRADRDNRALINDDFTALLEWYRQEYRPAESARPPGATQSRQPATQETTRSEAEQEAEQSADQKAEDDAISSIPLRRVYVLDDAISLLLPESFTPMSPEMLRTKYPRAERPKIVYTNDDGTVNLAINHTRTRITTGQLAGLHETMERQFKDIRPAPEMHRSGTTSVGGRRAFLIDFTTAAVDTEIRNVMLGAVLESRLVLVSFNATVENEPTWLPVGYHIIESIRYEH